MAGCIEWLAISGGSETLSTKRLKTTGRLASEPHTSHRLVGLPCVLVCPKQACSGFMLAALHCVESYSCATRLSLDLIEKKRIFPGACVAVWLAHVWLAIERVSWLSAGVSRQLKASTLL